MELLEVKYDSSSKESYLSLFTHIRDIEHSLLPFMSEVNLTHLARAYKVDILLLRDMPLYNGDFTLASGERKTKAPPGKYHAKKTSAFPSRKNMKVTDE